MQAGKCKDIVDIMNKMSYKDLDDQQMQQLLRLKELLCGIVDGAKDVETEPSRIVEQVGLQDARSSNVVLFFFTKSCL